jgi:hypothetical protein
MLHSSRGGVLLLLLMLLCQANTLLSAQPSPSTGATQQHWCHTGAAQTTAELLLQ